MSLPTSELIRRVEGLLNETSFTDLQTLRALVQDRQSHFVGLLKFTEGTIYCGRRGCMTCAMQKRMKIPEQV